MLIALGRFIGSIVIGGSLALLAAGITRFVSGRSDASKDFIAWGAFISPVLAFFAAGFALQLFAQRITFG